MPSPILALKLPSPCSQTPHSYRDKNRFLQRFFFSPSSDRAWTAHRLRAASRHEAIAASDRKNGSRNPSIYHLGITDLRRRLLKSTRRNPLEMTTLLSHAKRESLLLDYPLPLRLIAINLQRPFFNYRRHLAFPHSIDSSPLCWNGGRFLTNPACLLFLRLDLEPGSHANGLLEGPSPAVSCGGGVFGWCVYVEHFGSHRWIRIRIFFVPGLPSLRGRENPFRSCSTPLGVIQLSVTYVTLITFPSLVILVFRREG